MSSTPIKIKLQTCCLSCPHIDIDANIERLFKDTTPYMAFGSIDCHHSPVCEKYKQDSSIDPNDMFNHASGTTYNTTEDVYN